MLSYSDYTIIQMLTYYPIENGEGLLQYIVFSSLVFNSIGRLMIFKTDVFSQTSQYQLAGAHPYIHVLSDDRVSF